MLEDHQKKRLGLLHYLCKPASFTKYQTISVSEREDLLGWSETAQSVLTSKGDSFIKAVANINTEEDDKNKSKIDEKPLVERIIGYQDLYLVYELRFTDTPRTTGVQFLAIPAKADEIKREEKQEEKKEGQSEKFSYNLKPRIDEPVLLNPLLLSGKGKETELEFGTEENYCQARKTPPPKTDSWSVWHRHAIALLEQVTNCTLGGLSQKIGEQIAKKLFVYAALAKPEMSNDTAITRTLALYDYLLGDHEPVSKTALPHILNILEQKAEPVLEETNDPLGKQLEENCLHILGHMDEQKGHKYGNRRDRSLFPLDNTQRLATWKLGECDTGEVLAINGPPGSGKTAMLKAVIGHQWVEAAYNQQPCPITLAVGATNQSVTNVINAFHKVPYQGEFNPRTQETRYAKDCQIYKRWIPACLSYGTYFPSRSKLEGDYKMPQKEIDAMVIGTVCRSGEMNIYQWYGKDSELSKLSKRQELEAFYCSEAAKYFETPEVLDLNTIIQRLLKELKEKADEMQEFHRLIKVNYQKPELVTFITKLLKNENSRKSASDILKDILCLGDRDSDHNSKINCLQDVVRERLRDDNSVSSELTDTQVEEYARIGYFILLDRYLDVTFRADLFHIAARYWEGMYIKDILDAILVAKNRDNMERALRRMCMLTPCLVSTMNNTPALFQMDRSPVFQIDRYLLGKVDLLIMDETGQGKQTLAVPLLALARRALAVGDVKQLKPVVTDEELDNAQEQYAYIHKGYDEKAYSFAVDNDLTLKNHSMLDVMRRASFFSYQGEGLLLRGHYRCQTNIIQLCNEMVYDNKLFFLEKDNAERGPFHSFSWVNSSSQTQKLAGGSRANLSEARLIAKFLLEYWPKIYKCYSSETPDCRLDELVAIVTPFRGQVDALKSALQKELAETPTEGIDQDDIDKMTIGTVDSLQGAEKPVVLFSAVQGCQDGGEPYFADQPYLINVAISRAQDCFIAFLCQTMYGIGQTYTPSELDELKKNSAAYLGYYLGSKHKKKPRCQRLLPNTLVIIEAPGKCKTLQKYLGLNFEVIVTGGSITEIEECTLEQLIRRGLRPRYQLKEKGADLIRRVREQADSFESIILATDDDYVGETIAWHIAMQFRQEPVILNKMSRVRLSALDEASIKTAFGLDKKKSKENQSLEGIGNSKQNTINDIIDVCRVRAEIVREVTDLLVAKQLEDTYRAARRSNYLQHENITFALEQGLICDNKSNKDINPARLGRVKMGILDLLSMPIKANLANNIPAHPILKVQDLTLTGKIRGEPELVQRFINNLNKTDNFINKRAVSGDPDTWIYEQQDTGIDSTDKIPTPGTSTIEVLQYASHIYKMMPEETMATLQTLYTGDYDD